MSSTIILSNPIGPRLDFITLLIAEHAMTVSKKDNKTVSLGMIIMILNNITILSSNRITSNPLTMYTKHTLSRHFLEKILGEKQRTNVLADLFSE